MLRYLMIFGMFAQGACMTPTTSVDEANTYSPITFASSKASADEIQQCKNAGGEVMRVGRLGNETCVQNLPDAGKACSDKADCVGRCVMENEMSDLVPGTEATGVCEATDNRFGCTTLIANGTIEGTLCID